VKHLIELGFQRDLTGFTSWFQNEYSIRNSKRKTILRNESKGRWMVRESVCVTQELEFGFENRILGRLFGSKEIGMTGMSVQIV
jgi:hypothetical protein